MDAQQIHDQAESAEKKVELGDTSGLREQLNGMSPADRLAAAREMEKINQDHRQVDDSLPRIDVCASIDESGTERLVAIDEREKRSWYNPSRWFGDTYDDPTMVYCPPFDENKKATDGSSQKQDLDMALQLLLFTLAPESDRAKIQAAGSQ